MSFGSHAAIALRPIFPLSRLTALTTGTCFPRHTRPQQTEPLDLARVHAGEQSPVFFGSAMTNFGVDLFLKKLLALGSPPKAMRTFGAAAAALEPEGPPGASGDAGARASPPLTSALPLPQSVGPEHPEFSGVVFKLQANLDPRHRDRLAFVRVVSGGSAVWMGLELHAQTRSPSPSSYPS